MRGGVVLATNVSTVAATSPVAWIGGRTSLVIVATTFPSSCKLQMQAMDASWVDISASSVAANSVIPYDLPAGQYRIAMVGGTVAGLYANLQGIPYN